MSKSISSKKIEKCLLVCQWSDPIDSNVSKKELSLSIALIYNFMRATVVHPSTTITPRHSPDLRDWLCQYQEHRVADSYILQRLENEYMNRSFWLKIGTVGHNIFACIIFLKILQFQGKSQK